MPSSHLLQSENVGTCRGANHHTKVYCAKLIGLEVAQTDRRVSSGLLRVRVTPAAVFRARWREIPGDCGMRWSISCRYGLRVPREPSMGE